MVTFEEIPLEVTLSLSITNCLGKCPGCHSPELRGNTGTPLTDEELDALMTKNKGVTCVLLLGEGNNTEELLRVAERIRNHWGIKVALYSGREEVEDEIYRHFDYVKVGSYKEEFGPLNKVTTNQRLYAVKAESQRIVKQDITYMFWHERR